MFNINSFQPAASKAADILMRRTLVVLTVALVGAGAAFASNIVTNGSFETGDFTGWSETGNASVCQQGFASPYCGDAYDGNYSVSLNAGDVVANMVLSQVLATTAGDTYDLSFAYGTTGLQNPQTLDVFVDDGVTLGDILNTTAVSPPGNSGYGSYFQLDNWGTYSFAFTATSSATTLTFADDPSNTAVTVSEDGKLDDVQVVAASAPEPASFLLLGTALVVIGRAARKYRIQA